MKLTTLIIAAASFALAASVPFTTPVDGDDEPRVVEVNGRNVTLPGKCKTHPKLVHKGWSCLADPVPRYTPQFGTCGTNPNNVCHTPGSCCVSRLGWKDNRMDRGTCVKAPPNATEENYYCVQDVPLSGALLD